ncbi:MAG: HNH endonuclease [Candidatus Odinarchaeota archaeon]
MANRRKQNKYDLTGKYGIGYTSKGEEFYFDFEDYETIKDYCWSINKLGYLLAKRRDNPKRTIYMHRMLMKDELAKHKKKLQVDHIDNIKVNNRRNNLRLATAQQNRCNRRKIKSNTSGVIGVSWKEKDKKWHAALQVNRKRKYLGCYDTKEEAIIARIEGEKKYFGEFRPTYRNTKFTFTTKKISFGEQISIFDLMAN